MNILYAFFELAVRYLVDTYGVEKCKPVYLDIRRGMSFEEASIDQYTMNFSDFQDSFFSLMQEYLP